MEKNWAALLKAPFAARIAVYAVVAAVAVAVAYEDSYDRSLFVTMGVAFVLPYLLHWIPRRFLDINTDVVMMYSDGFIAGFITSWWSFSPFPTLVLWTPILWGSMLIGGVSLLVKASVWGLIGIVLPMLTGGVRFAPGSGPITSLLCGAILLAWGGIASFLLYRTRVRLKDAMQDTAEKAEQLQGLASRLSKYLSPHVYNTIFTGSRDVKIGTSRKKLTVFFSDVQGFTQLTDSMESETLTSLLNKYQNEMTEIALRHGGTIDKFIGDAIVIFFGDPESRGQVEDALACVMMALEMRERMKSLRKEWEAEGGSRPLHIRMGINTGYCTVGNFGSENRLTYTIVGGQVNLASRLEHAAALDQILISSETHALVKDRVYCETKEEVMVKGIAYPVQTYEVIGLPEEVIGAKGEMRKETDGFTLSVEFHKVPRSEREVVLAVLEEAVSRLRRLP